MNETKRGSTRARGIDRAIEIFGYLHQRRSPARVGEIAKALRAPRSSAYEIINRLLEAELLETQADGALFFGRAMHYYGADYVRNNSLMQHAQREVARLADHWGETTQFCMLNGNKYTVVIMDTGRRTFKVSSDIGVKVPIPWTASGRLLLSGMSDREIREFIPPEDFTLQDGRILEEEGFFQEIAKARVDGYSCTTGLVDNFTICMAAPVTARSGEVVATICFMITRDTSEAHRADLLDALRESGKRLSAYAR